MTRLVDAGMVAADWTDNEYKGIVENSVVVFVTRPGNPENIQDWDDLVTGDVEVLTPNPFTSGGARWNLMAGYGNKVITEGVRGEAFSSSLTAQQRARTGRERPRCAGNVPRRSGRRAPCL